MLAGMTGPDDQGEIGLLLHSGGKEEYVWNIVDPPGSLLVLPCPLIKVNGKRQKPNPDRITNDPDKTTTPLLGRKVCVILLGNQLRRLLKINR